jgi:hypothetical protein
VGDHLGVGLGGEHGALANQALLQRDVVLDDAVDDDVHAIGRVVVGMRVLLSDPAVGRPARMPDAGARIRPLGHGHRAGGLALGGVSLADRAAQRAQVSDRAHRVDPVAVQHRDPRAVVSAVLQLLEAGQEQAARFSGTDVADDAAHVPKLLDCGAD